MLWNRNLLNCFTHHFHVLLKPMLCARSRFSSCLPIETETNISSTTTLSHFFWGYFFGLFLALLIEQLKTWTGNRMRERGGVTRGKGLKAQSQTRVRCSKDKASVVGTPALPTELKSLQILWRGYYSWPYYDFDNISNNCADLIIGKFLHTRKLNILLDVGWKPSFLVLCQITLFMTF